MLECPLKEKKNTIKDQTENIVMDKTHVKFAIRCNEYTAHGSSSVAMVKT